MKLDPDQIECPRCTAKPGAICTTPTGKRAKTIHAERRAAADKAPPPERAPSAAPSKKRARKGPPATRESRAKGARATNKIRAEKVALVREIVGEIRANALVERAQELAENAVRFDADRMVVKRLALDATLVSVATFVEALEGYRRVRLDDEGRPALIPIEGPRGGVTLAPDYRGGTWGPDDVKALAVAYGVALDKLRLEEGSATSRSEHVHETGLTGRSDEELAQLVERGRQALRDLGEELPS